MSAEKLGNIEDDHTHFAFPIGSIVCRESDTMAFFDDIHLSYLTNAYFVPKEDTHRAIEVRDMLWDNPRALKQYGHAILKEALLFDRANYDELTSLPKGDIWLERANEAAQRCEASNGREWLGVLFIDLSGFKRVNDTAGHMAGDSLLQKMGKGLREYTRKEDTASSLGRVGGDEFAVLLKFSETRIRVQMDREERTARAAARIANLLDTMLAQVLDTMQAEDERLSGLTVTAVTGYATWQPGMTAEQLLKTADDVMNVAKRQRKEAELQTLDPEKRVAYEHALDILQKAGWMIDPRDGVLKLA